MSRTGLFYHPQWEGPVENWTRKISSQNLWRVKGICEYEDLIQEGYLKFMHVSTKYPRVQTPEHFMSLYMRAFSNRLHDLSRKRKTQISDYIVPKDILSELETVADISVVDAESHVIITFAPPELRQLFEKLLSGNYKKFYTRRASLSRICRRKTTNEVLCRIAGLDHRKVDLHTMAREYLDYGI